jgi:hypothetical protein
MALNSNNTEKVIESHENNNNLIQLFILCAVSIAKRPITDTAQHI